MNSTIEKLVEELRNYPHLGYVATSNSITVDPNSDEGFQVTLDVNANNTFTVFFDSWHEEFDDEEQALNCFAFGLSNKCRLRVMRKGGKPYKWVLEYKKNNKWFEHSDKAKLSLDFWSKSTEEILQNKLIEVQMSR